jgi:hypothetical protein
VRMQVGGLGGAARRAGNAGARGGHPGGSGGRHGDPGGCQQVRLEREYVLAAIGYAARIVAR